MTACFITGTVMMKMISNTSITSMNGTMLISLITSSVSSAVNPAMAAYPFFMATTFPSLAAVTRAPVT